MSDFVHLRLHSEFSLEDGTITLKQLIKHCQEQAFPAVAVTDMSNFFGLVRFYSSAVSAGVKPIMGMDVWLESAQTKQNSHKLCLLVQNAQGYKNLVELISKAYREHYLEGKPTIKREWLAAQHEGLIALTCAEEGELGQLVLEGKLPQALDEARWLKHCFADRLYIELVRTGQPHQEELVHGSAAIAYQANLPIVATNNARFIRREDFEAHEVRVCIHQGYVLYDERRPKRYTPEQYVKSADEMSSLFADYPEAIANTAIIAQRCNFQLHTGENFLPDFPVPEGMTTAEHLVHVSREGLENRFKTILASIDESEQEKTRRVYNERLDFELRIINEMGFPGYFLIVADFIQWAKDHDIPVGPGRGSGAGSLVAYALEITNLDPIEYELLFERFLNPERVSMPDFDIDFCMDRREEVIDYVKDLYGKDAVSQIVTYGTLAARAVIKDVTRVQGKPYGLGDRMSKLIPGTPGMTLSKAYDQEPALREFLDRDDDAEMAQEIWTMAKKLEGLSRNTGKHAAGIVIAPGKLTDFSPLYCDENGDNLVTHYDKDDVEKIGLVKFDFLGLKTLTLIDWAVQLINQKHEKTGQTPLDIDEIDLEDRATYELLSSGQTTAIFQLESSGMKQLIKRLRPSLFEDIIALVALYRPGPLGSGMVDDFVDRKHGIQKVEYPHPSLEPILKETYGTLVYQEQIMQTAQVLSSYTLGEADMLRRAMGKKK
ncbi:MAG: DNA polymerase III subunit alpha, partial [Pseudomonadota bacterium]|nr:DNA polymerase III subunit alpha [Pseudomonadota bacterium]